MVRQCVEGNTERRGVAAKLGKVGDDAGVSRYGVQTVRVGPNDLGLRVGGEEVPQQVAQRGKVARGCGRRELGVLFVA
jgi:hypothetical protein